MNNDKITNKYIALLSNDMDCYFELEQQTMKNLTDRNFGRRFQEMRWHQMGVLANKISDCFEVDINIEDFFFKYLLNELDS